MDDLTSFGEVKVTGDKRKRLVEIANDELERLYGGGDAKETEIVYPTNQFEYGKHSTFSSPPGACDSSFLTDGTDRLTEICDVTVETEITHPEETNIKNSSGCSKCGIPNLENCLPEAFEERVCFGCKVASSDYDLITQSEVLSNYLITEGSLKQMKYLVKNNPKRAGWSQMKLYLRKHAKEKAVKRWGSLENLQKEINKRQQQKFDRSLEKTKDFFKIPFVTSPSDKSDKSAPPEKKSKKSKFLLGALSAIRGTPTDEK
mmetsp:Transcript_18066/g.18128  ORF Transcript_18066/g.18128 Transcript_18066/m.18128 type:complete len:260 (+) Transcript_18066:152-931(+)